MASVRYCATVEILTCSLIINCLYLDSGHKLVSLEKFGEKYFRKKTEIVQNNRQEKERQMRSPGDEHKFFCKAVQNGGTFHTFREEEITELLPKNIARAANPNGQVDSFHLKNICWTKH